MDKDKILETIQHMIALSENNPNEHEAQLAAQKAQEYMLKYNIGLSEVNNYSSVEWLDHEAHESGRLTEMHRAALSIVVQFYFVKVVYDNKYLGRKNGRRRYNTVIRIFGEKHNVEVATYIYHFLVRIYTSLWEDARQIYGLDRSQASGYHWGLTAGLAEKLQADRKAKFGDNKSQNALVLLQTELDNKLNEKYPDLVSTKAAKINLTSYNVGREDSKYVNIKDGLKGHSGNLGAERVKLT